MINVAGFSFPPIVVFPLWKTCSAIRFDPASFDDQSGGEYRFVFVLALVDSDLDIGIAVSADASFLVAARWLLYNAYA